ncbi:hypothetical protein NQZ68_029808 [Dissostichus eleginoides]|nr:hypothetical protein NQZ68_029808 [Dissostichus eleginoides]
MSTKPKTHKAMGDAEWLARLKAFANSGVWPSEGGINQLRGNGNGMTSIRSSPSTSSVRTSMPAPSSVSSPSTSSVRTSMPAPSSVSNAVNTILAVGSNESGGDEPATAAAALFWLPREMSKTIPVQDQRLLWMTLAWQAWTEWTALAECLVGLRNQLTMVLTNQQVSNIVALWQNLLDYDKQRVVFAARHQSRLDTGRFRSPKKRQEFTPGVESLKRHALTTTAPLSQWPDCCRLIEAIFVRLCVIHRSPRKRGTGTVSRWDLILEDYRKIRRCILSNGTVMQQTTLQLVDVSHTILVQWHNKRVKRDDNALVLQGLVVRWCCSDSSSLLHLWAIAPGFLIQ